MITDMRKYIDIGVNLTGSAFDKDLAAVVDRALQSGVVKMIVTGTDLEHSLAAIELSCEYPGVCYATVGIHPHHASDYSVDLDSELRELLSQEGVVAVGECGLDFNRNFSTRSEQLKAFEAQLAIAADIGKPLFLHQRDAHDDFVAMIKDCRGELGSMVSHCFTGNADEATELLELDMYLGITGWICDERRGQALQQAVSHIPLDRVMIETDAPYLLPRDLNQKTVQKNRNEPCYLPHIAETVANFMRQEERSLVDSAFENTRKFFSL